MHSYCGVFKSVVFIYMQQHEITKFKCYNSFHECDNLVCVTEFIDDSLDFPLHRLALFFSISSTRKCDPLGVIVNLVFAENQLLARWFGMICVLSK